MSEKTLNTRLQVKRDTETNWGKATNFIPKAGEPIFYTDLKKFKIGDGITTVNNLPFIKEDYAGKEEGPTESLSQTIYDKCSQHLCYFQTPESNETPPDGIIDDSYLIMPNNEGKSGGILNFVQNGQDIFEADKIYKITLMIGFHTGTQITQRNTIDTDTSYINCGDSHGVTTFEDDNTKMVYVGKINTSRSPQIQCMILPNPISIVYQYIKIEKINIDYKDGIITGEAKERYDNYENDKLSKSGDTMSGDLSMSSNQIKDLATPTLDTDAATKKYVDDHSSSTNLVFYGVCDTAAATANKVCTLINSTGFSLSAGVTIIVKFTNNNSKSNPTLNVNNTGALPMYQYGTTVMATANETSGWLAGACVMLTYDGNGWVRDQGFNTNSTYYYSAIICSTSSSTAAKTGTTHNYNPNLHTYIVILMRNANIAKSALTLEVSPGTAKPIYINGQPSSATNYALPLGSYLVYYDGENYYFNTDGKLYVPDPTDDYDAVNYKTYKTYAEGGENNDVTEIASSQSWMNYDKLDTDTSTAYSSWDGLTTLDDTKYLSWSHNPFGTITDRKKFNTCFYWFDADITKTYKITICPSVSFFSFDADSIITSSDSSASFTYSSNKLTFIGKLPDNDFTFTGGISEEGGEGIYVNICEYSQEQDGIISGTDKAKYDKYQSDIFYASALADSAQTVANAAQSTANSAFTKANAALPKTGGTMTGALTLNSTLTAKSTTTLKGNVNYDPTSTSYKFNMNNHKIEGVSDPTANNDAANKKYVDDQFAKLGHSTLVWTRTDGTTFNEDVVVWNS